MRGYIFLSDAGRGFCMKKKVGVLASDAKLPGYDGIPVLTGIYDLPRDIHLTLPVKFLTVQDI
jgi:hypothetical protein